MSFAGMLVRQVTVITPGTATDPRYHQTVRDWDDATETTEDGWYRERSSTETDEGRDTVTTSAVVFVLPGSAVTQGCRVRVSGVLDEDGSPLLFSVDGRPKHANTPAGLHHIEAALTQVTG